MTTLALVILGGYFVVGLLFGWAFVLRGADALDPAARSTRWPTRLMWLPGAAALWPVLARKWLRAKGAER
jgi:membrane-associated PAP2 superfamily phosphatase